MTKCNSLPLDFATTKGRYITADFSGGDISSDGGSLLIRQLDRKLGLTRRVAQVISDGRDQSKVTHSTLSLIRQQIFSLAQGYEDLNDHTNLRNDIVFQSCVGSDTTLSSSSTLSRFQTNSSREDAVALHKVLVEQFIASYSTPPKEIILDFDATDDPTHGNQEGAFYHGYYHHHCYLPLYVFCGSHLLCAYLRQSNIDGAKHTGAILKLLVTKIRKAWPECRIIFRGDGGFCRVFVLKWCERNGVDYIVGYSKNNRLLKMTEDIRSEAQTLFKQTGEKQRLFKELFYAAGTWEKKRRVIAKAEIMEQGDNNRYIVTTLEGDPQEIYDSTYCARGDMENRIKEQQLDLFADRTSSSDWWANQLRLLLSGLAYTLIDALRRVGTKGTELEKAQSGTIRLKLLKIGAVVMRNTRRIKVMFATNYPYQNLFREVYTNVMQI